MDLFYNSLTNFPESSNDYISHFISNKLPNIYAMLAVIIVFFFIFSYYSSNEFSQNTEYESTGNIKTLEIILIGIFVILVLFNLVYLNTDNININTSLSNVLDSDNLQLDIDVNKFKYEGKKKDSTGEDNSDKDTIDTDTIDTDKDIIDSDKYTIDSDKDSDSNVFKQLKEKEVFHVSRNVFNFLESKALCKAYGGRLATYDELEDAYKKGGDWCSYGWSKNQMALFPTQKEKWSELQKIKGHQHDCGRPGINGGFIDNPDVRFGVNCYGNKPVMTDPDILNKQIYPITKDDIKLNRLSNAWKKKLKDVEVSPFNNQNWSVL